MLFMLGGTFVVVLGSRIYLSLTDDLGDDTNSSAPPHFTPKMADFNTHTTQLL